MSSQPEAAQVDAVVRLLVDVLGEDLVGVALHGSAVLGGLRPGSDVDVLVLSRRPTTHDEKRRLAGGLGRLSNRADLPAFRRPLELTIVVAGDIRPWRYPPPIDFLYGEWLRAEMERGDVEPAAPTSPDLACVLALARQGNRALTGPPPAELLDPVPFADLVRAMLDELPSLLADLDSDTANVLLTLARIWTTILTGTIQTKDAAADRVVGRLSAELRPVLIRARAVYLGEAADRWDDLRQGILPTANALLDGIETARAADGA